MSKKQKNTRNLIKKTKLLLRPCWVRGAEHGPANLAGGFRVGGGVWARACAWINQYCPAKGSFNAAPLMCHRKAKHPTKSLQASPIAQAAMSRSPNPAQRTSHTATELQSHSCFCSSSPPFWAQTAWSRCPLFPILGLPRGLCQRSCAVRQTVNTKGKSQLRSYSASF